MSLPIVSGLERREGLVALQWWNQVCEPVRGDPAARARLRRCRSSLDAIGIPAALSLARRLGATAEGVHPGKLEAALGLARVLAHVPGDGSLSAMRVVGWSIFPDDRAGGKGETSTGPRLSEARFRRLLQAVPGEELTRMVIRLMHLVGGPINIRELAQDYLDWHRDSTRYRWAFQYYAAGAATPDASDSEGEDTA
jgi:CRISPR system Cascade subunit CasB